MVCFASVIAVASACEKKDPNMTNLGGEENPPVEVVTINSDIVNTDVVDEPVEEEPYEETREGFVRSELSNEWIDEKLENQRPIAVMVDNELTALDHYGVNQADVVYELMNSTANGRVTRLMCLVKDWKNLEQFGSVRSTRPTNVIMAAEWNAILVHDGGPYYINDWLAKPWGSNHLSGGFARYTNGKNWEYTEYVTSQEYYNADQGKSYAGLIDRIASAGYSETYNDYYQGQHFEFVDVDADYSDHGSKIQVKEVDLPYPHNSSKLIYNEETQTYDYYCYGDAHIDPLDGNKVMSFKNLILYSVDYSVYDEHGYLIYNCIGAGDKGYFISNGVGIPIHWAKPGEDQQTIYYDLEKGGPIKLNTGKTYITMVPSDVWDDVVYK